jgi:hypothetical protein
VVRVFQVSRVEKPPGEGTDVVEELEGGVGSFGVDGARAEEELEVGVDLLRRGVRDSAVVISVEA